MATVATVLGLIFLLFVAAGVYTGVKAARRAKRSIDRTVGQARRTVEDTRLRAMRVARPGASGELAELRLSLRTSLRATREALDAAAPGDTSLSEALGLFERLSAHGRELDDELRRLEQEPDKGRLAALLPGLRERAERITHSADSLRWASRDRARRFAEDDLEALGRDIELETGALRHWTPSQQEETQQEGMHRGEPQRGEARQPPSPRREQSQSPPSAEGRLPADGTPPPPITAPDPERTTRYSWRKSPRPESSA